MSDTPGRPRRCVVGFGELLLRLATPGRRLIAQTQSFDVELGGAEANVIAGLAALGHDARFVSALPDNSLGELARSTMAARGIDTVHVAALPGRMGLYFLELGQGARASRITYDRSGSAFARARSSHFDFANALGGADLLHLSGITPALGHASCNAVLVAAEAARAAGVAISVDCNFRESLWAPWDGNPRETLTQLIGHADIVFGNHRDIAMLTGKPFESDGPERRRVAATRAFETFPRLQYLASTAREVVSADHNRLAARVDSRDGAAQTEALEITGIVDRIGTGDAFAAGVLHRWLGGNVTPESMASAGLALAALKHSLPGDMPLFDEAQLAHFERGGRDVLR